LDRWVGRTFSGAGAFSMQQVADAPEGFEYSNKITVTTAATSGVGGYGIEQRIEGQNLTMLGYGTSAAKILTVSFWIKASVVGTYSVSLRTSTGGVSGISTCKNTFTISVANTWQKVTNTFPANTAYDTLYNNTTGIFFDINFGAQTSKATSTLNTWELGNYLYATGQTDVMQTLGATINITGVQLEANTTATPFENLQYEQQLALCQRYYTNITGASTSIANCAAWSATTMFGIYNYPTTMRAAPTMTYSALADFDCFMTNGARTPTQFLSEYGDENGTRLKMLISGGVLGQAGWFATDPSGGTLEFSAEL
jgi:hypothetical protein